MNGDNKSLTLHRASAGSGKTYQLTKDFLWLFLTKRLSGHGRDLRKKEELLEGLSSILAVTFTNKATNEMKERIVARLSDMSPDSGLKNEKVPYLKEFADRLGCEPNIIRARAQDALAILLHNYSDFNVSTIDSFFQTILRTFAYETDLKNSYQVEIDSKALTEASLDATLSDVNRHDANNDSREWIEKIVEENASATSRWNIFQKSKSSKGASAYYLLNSAAEKMGLEQYMEIKEKMKKYFLQHQSSQENENVSYIHIFDFYDKKMQDKVERLFDSALAALDALQSALEAQGLWNEASVGTKRINGYEKVRQNKNKAKKLTGIATILKPEVPLKAPVARRLGDEVKKELEKLAQGFIDAMAEWENYLADGYALWKNMRPNLMQLALMQAVAKNTDLFLTENNLVELAQTNLILQKIIGDDETPFIYEKLGTRLAHFLIDEFQDTSALQWENLKPLVGESLGESNENLIIGDAKQSIYRFRNADPSLITTQVPTMDFPGASIKGEKIQENTNYRSAGNLIRLFNSLFSFIPPLIDGKVPFHKSKKAVKGAEKGDGWLLEPIYKGSIQGIPADPEDDPGKKKRGYAECTFTTWSSKALEDLDEPIAVEHLKKLGKIVEDALERGYSQKDIAFLVRKNKEAQWVIKALLEHTMKDGRKIDILSDEALFVNSSSAVKAVVAILRMAASKDTEQRKNVRDYATRFNYYYIRECAEKGENIARERALLDFLKVEDSALPFEDVFAHLKAMTLPAMVESVISSFISQEERERELPYLAAFQDAVLEYSQRESSDVASFVKWWDTKKEKMAIAAPKNADAVTVMTYHKAKGLEYPIVILPLMNLPFLPNLQLRRWEWIDKKNLSAALPEDERYPLPPYLPVKLTDEIGGTEACDYLGRYEFEEAMDVLNNFYVAMTRPVEELYVFAKTDYMKNDSEEKYATVTDVFYAALDSLEKRGEDETHEDYMLSPDSLRSAKLYEVKKEGEAKDNGEEVRGKLLERTFIIGEKNERCPDKIRNKRRDSGKKIESYYVNPSLPLLYIDEAEEEEEKDAAKKAREEGELLHSVMERVVLASDLPKALRKARALGLIGIEKMEEVREFLSGAISREGVSEWFTPRYDVITERQILAKDHTHPQERRPDRIMLDREKPGRIVVVDYKFGSRELHEKHLSQMRHYLRLLRQCYPAAKVEGYLWYITEDILELVP